MQVSKLEFKFHSNVGYYIRSIATSVRFSIKSLNNSKLDFIWCVISDGERWNWKQIKHSWFQSAMKTTISF